MPNNGHKKSRMKGSVSVTNLFNNNENPRGIVTSTPKGKDPVTITLTNNNSSTDRPILAKPESNNRSLNSTMHMNDAEQNQVRVSPLEYKSV